MNKKRQLSTLRRRGPLCLALSVLILCVLDLAAWEPQASLEIDDLERMDFEELPQPVRAAAREAFPQDPLMAVERSGGPGGEAIYHVMFEVDGAEAGLRLNRDGRVLDRWRFELEPPAAEGLAPTFVDLEYGPFERNRLDLWLAESVEPTPLLICIHGGGFSGGDKEGFRGEVELLRAMLDAGISVAAINYRLTDGGRNPFPIPMEDGALAIQFLRRHADKYHLDKSRFGATGGSAGGCMLMWLGFHPDMAVPDHADPVRRESTRLQALAPYGGQSCLHLPTLARWFGATSLEPHPAYGPLFGMDVENPFPLAERFDVVTREASPITYLTEDDPPIYLLYGDEAVPVSETTSPGVWVHHPMMGIRLKEAMDPIGVECHVEYPGEAPDTVYGSQIGFLIAQLQGRSKTAN